MSVILPLQVVTTTIPNGTALSGAVYVGGAALTAIRVPAAWTAANITFQASLDGSTNWFDVFDAQGAELTAAAAASRHIALLHTAVRGFPYLRLRSGTTATPVNQGADRVMSLVLGGAA